jgi:hypothetical protein
MEHLVTQDADATAGKAGLYLEIVRVYPFPVDRHVLAVEPPHVRPKERTPTSRAATDDEADIINFAIAVLIDVQSGRYLRSNGPNGIRKESMLSFCTLSAIVSTLIPHRVRRRVIGLVVGSPVRVLVRHHADPRRRGIEGRADGKLGARGFGKVVSQ